MVPFNVTSVSCLVLVICQSSSLQLCALSNRGIGVVHQEAGIAPWWLLCPLPCIVVLQVLPDLQQQAHLAPVQCKRRHTGAMHPTGVYCYCKPLQHKNQTNRTLLYTFNMTATSCLK